MHMATALKARLWEVDAARGIAILMMALSNALFDLHLFAGCFWCYEGLWVSFARVTAGLFILLAGVSVTLSYSRAGVLGTGNFRKYLKRGLRIFSYGLLVTAATWVFLGERAVLFGILHLIGVSIIISYPLLKSRLLPLALGIAAILLGVFLETLRAGFPWLLWLGIRPAGLASVDYTPLFSWFGVFLVGVFLGNMLFPGGKRRLGFFDRSRLLPGRLLAWLGRHSLFIYLAHQPLLIGLLSLLLGRIPF